MKNEEQYINFSLIQPLCVFICYDSLISLFFFYFLIPPSFLDGRERLNFLVFWHAVTITVCKLNIIS